MEQVVTAVILSGGVGKRFDPIGKIPKQYLEFRGQPVFMWSLLENEANISINNIVIVADASWHEYITEWAAKKSVNKITAFAKPGESRQGSVYNALCVIKQRHPDTDLVIIQDAARPLVTQGMIDDCITACADSDGAVVSQFAQEGFCYSDDGKHISSFVDYTKTYVIQSPDCYRFEKYYQINAEATEEEMTASRGCMHLAVRKGLTVALVPHTVENIKITLPSDLEKLERLMDK